MFKQDPNICGGALIIKGTRIPVNIVIELHHQGADIVELLETFPSLTEEQVKFIIEERKKNV